jgi:hypothetical protein
VLSVVLVCALDVVVQCDGCHCKHLSFLRYHYSTFSTGCQVLF